MRGVINQTINSLFSSEIIQISLSQIPNFHKLSVLSVVAAVKSFAYSFVGLALSIAKVAGEGGHVETGLTGMTVGENQSSVDKMWIKLSAFGNIAVAYAFSIVLIEFRVSPFSIA
ncbi:amino acid permease 6-like [Olea europaea subsp. europaea]|uniref:Amino acid permease 6-like n=1 Tax=Olea europaea subsp. europaea TaxID=158383 RepID=A0A8S0SPB6_OLEEU|nr:amino acid permease 6-like [Olea europaea subsp. europaea]